MGGQRRRKLRFSKIYSFACGKQSLKRDPSVVGGRGFSRVVFCNEPESFEADIRVKNMLKPFPAVFIRAPLVQSASNTVDVLATYEGNIVAAKQGNILVTAFHPELTNDNRFMDMFVKMMKTRTI